MQTPHFAFVWVLGFSLAWGFAERAIAAQQSAATQETLPATWHGDATLRDVFFLNHDLGWAAGDHGTILRTENGGRSWTLAATPTTYSLRSIQFVDEMNGWAAGGRPLPLVDRTQAVLFRSRDGGRTWQSIDGTILPAIEQIHMSDGQHGWAWGAPTQHFPDGIVQTADGGRSWSDFAQALTPGWTAVAATRLGYAAARRDGPLGLSEGGKFRAARHPERVRRIDAIRFSDPSRGWAAGDGRVLTSQDGGQSWLEIEPPAEPLGAATFDFHTIDCSGERCWLAGSPGSYVFSHSTGHGWNRARTPIRTPIRKLFFLDEQHGWAVGDLGNILVTRDGGTTWQSQRTGGDRVGLLLVCRTPDAIPFEVLARQCADQGCLAAVAICQASGHLSDEPLRATTACLRQGVSSVEWLGRSPPKVLGHQLERLIRQLRPTAVVVADESAWTQVGLLANESPPRGELAAQDLAGAVKAAIAQAADPAGEREWINQAALGPWQTPFVFLTRETNRTSPWGSAEFLPALGQNLGDQVLISRGLVMPAWAPREFELIALSDGSGTSTTDLFQGLTRGPLSPPRRRELGPRGFIGRVKAIVNKRATLDQLLSQFDSSPTSLPVWRQRVDRLCDELPPDVAANWLWQLSEAYAGTPNVELAALARTALIEQFPDHPMAWESRLWLAAYYASDEAAWCEYRRQRNFAADPLPSKSAIRTVGLRAVPQKTTVDGITHLVWTPELPEDAAADPRVEIQNLAPNEDANDFAAFQAERWKRARAALSSVRQGDPELAANPRVAFAEALLKRKTEGFVAAELDLRRVRTEALSSTQRGAIVREQRLVGGRSWEELDGLFECPTADEKPFLDGVLEDGLWKSAAQSGRVLALTSSVPAQATPAVGSADAASPADPRPGQTELRWGRDDQYLYFAAICHGPADSQGVAASVGKRQRDQSLDVLDLLQIAIDIDRDGRSPYLFSIDRRGSFSDQAGRDRQWNPTWYFAHATHGLSWIVEAAIPLDQLAPPPVAGGDALWGIALRRRLPDGRVEAWGPLPAADGPRDLAGRLPVSEFLPSDGVLRLR
jgi:photosystem II stability/assembly factor-like uncharacterized protein